MQLSGRASSSRACSYSPGCKSKEFQGSFSWNFWARRNASSTEDWLQLNLSDAGGVSRELFTLPGGVTVDEASESKGNSVEDMYLEECKRELGNKYGYLYVVGQMADAN